MIAGIVLVALGLKKTLDALTPAATEIQALATLGIVAVLLTVLIAYERMHFAELRQGLRGQLASEAAAD